jgi:hypothetical protein
MDQIGSEDKIGLLESSRGLSRNTKCLEGFGVKG